MRVSADVLQKLKDPFGVLIPDREVTKLTVSDAIKDAKLLVTVGDATTERLVEFGLIPDIAVVDEFERRSRRRAPISYDAAELRCSNPRGSISPEALDVLKGAIDGEHPSRVIVDGEEDLLALPLFNLVPEGSVVLYGQPLEGLVVVRMTPAKQKEARALMGKIADNHVPKSGPRGKKSTAGKRRGSKPKRRH